VIEGLFGTNGIAGRISSRGVARRTGQGTALSLGSLLALALIKPQMILLVVIYLLLWTCVRWRIRWPFVAGFFSVSALLLVSSLLVWPRWIQEWLRVLFGYRQYSTPPLASHLLGHQIGSRLGPILIAALLVCALAVAWRMRHSSAASMEFALTLSFLLAITTITLLPGHAVYDHVLLLPGVILIVLSWRDFAASQPFRVILAITALAVFWPWISAPMVIAVRPNASARLIYFDCANTPIRTAASIPFGVCALLGLMMWRGADKKTRNGHERTDYELEINHRLRIFPKVARFFVGRSRSAARASAR